MEPHETRRNAVSETDRRAFLGKAGVVFATGGACSGLAVLQGSEPDGAVSDEVAAIQKCIAALGPDYIDGLLTLMAGLHYRGDVALTVDLAEWWLNRLDPIIELSGPGHREISRLRRLGGVRETI